MNKVNTQVKIWQVTSALITLAIIIVALMPFKLA